MRLAPVSSSPALPELRSEAPGKNSPAGLSNGVANGEMPLIEPSVPPFTAPGMAVVARPSTWTRSKASEAQTPGFSSQRLTRPITARCAPPLLRPSICHSP